MKPMCPTSPNQRRFPITDHCFQAGFGEWRYASPQDDNDDARRFHNFSREFLLESARERTKEMVVFGLIVITSAWPVVYMVIIVAKLLMKGHTGGH